MKKFLIVAPWLADFGHGILLTFAVSYFFKVEPQLIHFVFGILFSISPDIDGVKEFFKFKKIAASEENPRDHRDGLHYPIVWILLGLIFVSVNPFLGTLFTSAVIVHFLNDSWGAGWGVQWLWPLNKNSYKFFSRKDIDSYVGLDHFVIYWTQAEKSDYIKRLGNPNWLDDYFLGTKRPKIIIVEYGIFLFAVICFILYII